MANTFVSLHVVPGHPGKVRWHVGRIKICDRCGRALTWDTTYFYRRYRDEAKAIAKGYVPNLQPHCKECSRTRR